MTPEEAAAEEVKALTARLGRAVVQMLRDMAPGCAAVDGQTAMNIAADVLEQKIEERTL
jgi:hypothetical protein